MKLVQFGVVIAGLMMFAFQAYAYVSCPAAAYLKQGCICVFNNTDQQVVYEQFPNDIGDFEISAHQATGPCEGGVERVTLMSSTNTILLQTHIVPGQEVSRYDNNQLEWKIVSGAKK